MNKEKKIGGGRGELKIVAQTQQNLSFSRRFQGEGAKGKSELKINVLK